MATDSTDRALLAETCFIGQVRRRLGFTRPSLSRTIDLDPPTLRRRAESVSEPVQVEKVKADTVLYLAYGSNLCDETFLGKRKIKPLSAINVQVPELRLTFDLPGIPYIEPCFADSGERDPNHPSAQAQADVAITGHEGTPLLGTEYRKDRWKKGLLGTVYEVTKSDYAHIIATEGGGSSYTDVLVDCFPLSRDPKDAVPWSPETTSFKAHTLFAPIGSGSGRLSRPDPSYAQASARYLKLITDGARERGLPLEYQKYLNDLRPFQITTRRQRAGQMIFSAIWYPIIMFIFTLSKMFSDKKGKAPRWVARIVEILFKSVWLSYDTVFKPIFGDGERTIPSDEVIRRDLPITEKVKT